MGRGVRIKENVERVKKKKSNPANWLVTAAAKFQNRDLVAISRRLVAAERVARVRGIGTWDETKATGW